MIKTAVALIAALAALALASGAAALPPGGPPAIRGAKVAPPPAWIAVGGRSAWLAFGSTCWKTSCIDFIPPPMRKDVPTVTAARGAVARLHFGFQPTKVTVAWITEDGLSKATALTAARVTRWKLGKSGLAVIAARPPSAGEATYLVRVRLA